MGSNKAGSSYDENRGGTSFQNDLAAMTKAAKQKGVWQGARAEAVAELRKNYGRRNRVPLAAFINKVMSTRKRNKKGA